MTESQAEQKPSRAKRTEVRNAQIRELAAKGVKQREIALAFGLTQPRVSQICK